MEGRVPHPGTPLAETESYELREVASDELQYEGKVLQARKKAKKVTSYEVQATRCKCTRDTRVTSYEAHKRQARVLAICKSQLASHKAVGHGALELLRHGLLVELRLLHVAAPSRPCDASCPKLDARSRSDGRRAPRARPRPRPRRRRGRARGGAGLGGGGVWAVGGGGGGGVGGLPSDVRRVPAQLQLKRSLRMS